jgi:hypothetical protein
MGSQKVAEEATSKVSMMAQLCGYAEVDVDSGLPKTIGWFQILPRAGDGFISLCWFLWLI